MMALPEQWTVEPWLKAWSTAQIGVEPVCTSLFYQLSDDGCPGGNYFFCDWCINGYVLTKWRFKGDTIIFG